MILVYDKLRIETSISKEDVISKLHRNMVEGSPNIMVKEHDVIYKKRQEFLIGKIEKDFFKATRLTKYGRDSWAPVIEGRIEQGKNTTINIIFKPQIIISIFFIIAFGAIIFNFVRGATQGHVGIGQNIAFIIGYLFFYIPILIYFTNQVKKIKIFFEELFTSE